LVENYLFHHSLRSHNFELLHRQIALSASLSSETPTLPGTYLSTVKYFTLVVLFVQLPITPCDESRLLKFQSFLSLANTVFNSASMSPSGDVPFCRPRKRSIPDRDALMNFGWGASSRHTLFKYSYPSTSIKVFGRVKRHRRSMEPNSRLKNFATLYFSATGDLQDISHHIVMAVVRSLAFNMLLSARKAVM
jgi:hypothetical protein